MRRATLVLFCLGAFVLCSGCPMEDPQGVCRLECFLDCQTNSCWPTCEGERDVCYGVCEATHDEGTEALNTCKNDCAAQSNTCKEACEAVCTEQCNTDPDAIEACSDGEWDDWWGGIGG